MKILSFIFPAIVGFVFTTGHVLSQNSGESAGQSGFWELECSGGNFCARLDSISSLSRHEYVIDGAVKVYECTVGTSGGLVARFYYIEPIGAGISQISNSNTLQRFKDTANKVSNRAGTGDVETIVTKHYPDTTHAKTSEYRFKSRETIATIYAHAHRVWAEERGRGKGNKLTIEE